MTATEGVSEPTEPHPDKLTPQDVELCKWNEGCQASCQSGKAWRQGCIQKGRSRSADGGFVGQLLQQHQSRLAYHLEWFPSASSGQSSHAESSLQPLVPSRWPGMCGRASTVPCTGFGPHTAPFIKQYFTPPQSPPPSFSHSPNPLLLLLCSCLPPHPTVAPPPSPNNRQGHCCCRKRCRHCWKGSSYGPEGCRNLHDSSSNSERH